MSPLMPCLQGYLLAVTAIVATFVVLEKEPAKQTVGLSFYGLTLGLLFFVFQAPDVALSQIVIGAVALPLLVMLSMAKMKSQK